MVPIIGECLHFGKNLPETSTGGNINYNAPIVVQKHVDCRTHCEAEYECMGWSVINVTGMRNCWLKKGRVNKEVLVDHPNAVSGFRYCPSK